MDMKLILIQNILYILMNELRVPYSKGNFNFLIFYMDGTKVPALEDYFNSTYCLCFNKCDVGT